MVARSEHAFPGWVEEANRLLGQRLRPEVVDDWPTPPQVGDVRVAGVVAGRPGELRLVCVLGADSGTGVARVALVSNETEMASEGDVVVPGSGCGLTFDLLIEARAVGFLWWIQVGRKVARLDNGWIESVLRAVDAPPPAADASRAGPDVREAAVSRFQRAESATLHSLTAGCEASQASGVRTVPVVVDPMLLAQRRAETTVRHTGRLLEVARELAEVSTAVLPRQGLAEILTGCDTSQAHGPDLRTALRPLLEGALAGLGLEGGETRAQFEPARTGARPDADGTLSEALAGLAAANHGSVRLVTDRGAWTDQTADQRPLVAVRWGGGVRMQVVRHFLGGQP